MKTLQIHNRMQQLITTLSDGWRGFFAWGGSFSIGWITSQAALDTISAIAMIVGLLVGLLSLVGHIQKQIDRYNEKKSHK